MIATNKHPIKDARTVAIIRGSCSIPPSLKILALTTIIYTAAKKEVKPAISSVLKFVLCSFSFNNLSILSVKPLFFIPHPPTSLMRYYYIIKLNFENRKFKKYHKNLQKYQNIFILFNLS